jgi:hypothetical protein
MKMVQIEDTYRVKFYWDYANRVVMNNITVIEAT